MDKTQISYMHCRMFLDNLPCGMSIKHPNGLLTKVSSIRFLEGKGNKVKIICRTKAAKWFYNKRKFFSDLLNNSNAVDSLTVEIYPSYKECMSYVSSMDINKTLVHNKETLVKVSSLGFATKTPCRYKKIDIREAARWVHSKRMFFAKKIRE